MGIGCLCGSVRSIGAGNEGGKSSRDKYFSWESIFHTYSGRVNKD